MAAAGSGQSRVLIVGAGLTGSLLWRLLRPLSDRVDVELWDKATKAGGRACTSSVGAAAADLGLQCVLQLF